MLDQKTLFRPFYCDYTHKYTGSYYTNLAKCMACRKFPCNEIKKETHEAIQNSDLLRIDGGKFIPRRTRMYLFVKNDGSIEEAYQGFDPKEPNWDRLRDVNEVLYVSKVLVPQLKLVPKPKDEQDEVEAKRNSEAAPAKTPSKKGGKKKAAAKA